MSPLMRGGVFAVLVLALLLVWPGASLGTHNQTITLGAPFGSCLGTEPRIALSWSDGLHGSPTFQIFRKILPAGSYAQVGTTTANTFTDTAANGLVSDKSYRYQIREQGGTVVSNEVDAPGLYCPPVLSAPTASCQADGPHVALNWSGVSGALQGYEVYRNGVKIADTASTSYDDGSNLQSGTSYSYTIRAKWADGTSKDSAAAPSVIAAACAPVLNATSSCSAAAPGGPQTNLSWNTQSGVTSYQIYRKAQLEADFSLLDTVSGSAGSYTDVLVDTLPATYGNGGTVQYRITAVWPTQQATSNTVTQSIVRCAPFLTVSDDCALQGFRLSWTATQGTSHYNVYKDGSFISQLSPSQLFFPTTGVDGTAPVESHTYRVESDAQSPPLSSGDVAASIDCVITTPPAPPPVLEDPVPVCVSGNSRINLSWSSSENVNYYSLYRTQGANTIKVDLAGTTYSDQSIQSGFTYTYYVRATGPGGETEASPTKTITALSCVPPTTPSITLTNVCVAGVPKNDVTWTDSPEAVTYEIHRGLSSSTLSLLTTIDSSAPEFTSRTWRDTFPLNPSTWYYYKVVAAGPPGGPKSSSTTKSIFTQSCLPYTPSMSVSSACSGPNAVVNMSWWTTQANTAYYRVYRQDFGLIATIADPNARSWQDTTVFQNIAYNYKLEAVNEVGGISTQGYRSVTTANCAPPEDFTLSVASAPVCQGPYLRSDISWTSSLYADTYNLYRNRLNPDNSVAERTTHVDVTSVFKEIGLGSALQMSSNSFILNDLAVNTSAGGKNTVEFWMMMNGSYGTIMSWDQSFSLWSYWPCFGFGNMWRIHGITSDQLLNRWVHVAAIFQNGVVDNTTQELYINGVKQTLNLCFDWGTDSLSRTATPKASFGQGLATAYPFYWYYHSGGLDDLRMYNRALTAAEIAGHYNGTYTAANQTGLIGRWLMDEGTGQILSDSTNYGHDATVNNGATWITNGLQSQQKYNWQAEAFSPGGSKLSNITPAYTAPMCQPSQPGVTLVAACGPGSITVKWSHNIHANQYKIYRGATLIATVPQSTDVAARTFVDTNGGAGFPDSTTYTYRVDAVGTMGTVASQTNSVKTHDCSPPGTPINVSASFFCTGSWPSVSVSWGDVSNTTYYEVTRSDGVKSPQILDNNSPTYTWTDENPDPLVGTTYSYKVKAFGPGGQSGSSDPGDATIVSNDPLAPKYCVPSDQTISSLTTACASGAPQNTLVWYDQTPFNTSQYDIFRSATSTAPASTTPPFKIIPKADPVFSTRTLVDSTGLASITDYYYWVKAIGPVGESPISPMATVQTFGCVPPVPPVLDIADICTTEANPITLLTWNKTSQTTSYTLLKGGASLETIAHTSDGSIRHWLVAGPFYNMVPQVHDNLQTSEALAHDHIGKEFSIRPRAGETVSAKDVDGDFALTSTWQEYESPTDMVSMQSAIGNYNYSFAYAFTYIYSPVSRTVNIMYDGAEGMKIILNGVEVASNPSLGMDWHDSTLVKDSRVATFVNLNAGVNTLLVKSMVYHYPWNWAFYLRITDTGGADILNSVTAWDSGAVLGVNALYNASATGPGGTSGLSNQVASVPSDCNPVTPDVTVTQQCAAGDSQLLIEWPADVNAEYWTVYKKRAGSCLAPDAQFFVVPPPEHDYTDGDIESGIQYGYCVRAFGPGGAESAMGYPTPLSTEAPVCLNPPSTPALGATPTCSGLDARMDLTWAVDPTGNTLSYNVWRKNLGAGETVFTKVPALTNIDPAITFKQDYVDEGSDYVYQLEAVGAGDNNFAFSAETSIVTGDPTCSLATPQPPSLSENFVPVPIAGQDGTFSISIRWTDSDNPPADYYRIIRDGADITANLPLSCSTPTGGPDINCVDNFNLVNGDGRTYTYVIQAWNANGPSSSNPLSVFMPIARPGAITLTLKQNAAGDIVMTWNAVATTPAGQTVYYTAERDDTSDFATTVIPGCSGIVALTCTDTSPIPGEPWYRVRANNLGGESISSPIRSVLVDLPEKWREISPF